MIELGLSNVPVPDDPGFVELVRQELEQAGRAARELAAEARAHRRRPKAPKGPPVRRPRPSSHPQWLARRLERLGIA